MVKNPRAKGNRIERKAEEKLEKQGYNTSRMPHTRYGDNDHYNILDIIAAKPGAPFKCIQVKSNRPPNLTEFKEKVENKLPNEHAQTEIWTWHDYKGWKIRRLNRENKEWETIKDET